MAVVDEPAALVQLADVRPLLGHAVDTGGGKGAVGVPVARPQDRSRSRQPSMREPAASAESGQWVAWGQYSSQLISAVPR